jgi:hypothetical protein
MVVSFLGTGQAVLRAAASEQANEGDCQYSEAGGSPVLLSAWQLYCPLADSSVFQPVKDADLLLHHLFRKD